jgi:hypothetical protein
VESARRNWSEVGGVSPPFMCTSVTWDDMSSRIGKLYAILDARVIRLDKCKQSLAQKSVRK